MPWQIEEEASAIIVEMNSSAVNKQNPAYFADLHEACDRIDRLPPHKPVILTAKGHVFCAGIDFAYCFPLFATQDEKAIGQWYRDYLATNLRLFTLDRLTVAAVNGHAFAGGLILALTCDFRIGVEGDAKFALNEVPIGVPMPSAYTEMIRYRVGDRVASETILLGNVYDVKQAVDLGFLDETVPADRLRARALEMTARIHEDCWGAYAQAKRNLMANVLRTIEQDCPARDVVTLKVIASPPSLRAQAAKWATLKSKK
jgi:enoyl-CoA hydratase